MAWFSYVFGVLMRYLESHCEIIYKNNMPNYEGSNMANDFPIFYQDRYYHSSEALYQSLRFLKSEHYEKIIDYINVENSFLSKRKAYEYIDETRPDWEDVKVDTMEMVLRLKYSQHPTRIGNWLYKTNNREIVEKSYKDDFWGAIPNGKYLIGNNVLGILWMIIREEVINTS